APTWQFNNEILSRTNQATVVDGFRARQASVLSRITDPARIARLIDYERREDGTYTAIEFMDDLRKSIWKETSGTSAINVHRRALQRAYIERMEYLMNNEAPSGGFFGAATVNVSQSDIRPLVREQLQTLLREVNRASGRISDRATKAHLVDAASRIDNILNPK